MDTQNKSKTTKLPTEKRMSLVIMINKADAFHDEFHDLRADEQRPDPAVKHPGPGIHFPAQQEIRNELPTSRGQNCRKLNSKLPTAPPS